MKLECRVDRVGEQIVVALDGPIDLGTLPDLRRHVMRALDRFPGERLLVDLDQVTSLDDSGLGIVLALAAAARERSGELSLVCTNAKLRQRLTAMRLDRAVAVHASISAAAG